LEKEELVKKNTERGGGARKSASVVETNRVSGGKKKRRVGIKGKRHRIVAKNIGSLATRKRKKMTEGMNKKRENKSAGGIDPGKKIISHLLRKV